MTTQTQTAQPLIAEPAQEAPVSDPLPEEQRYRAGVYGLLAALLRAAPDQALLEHVRGLSQPEPANGDLLVALSMLGLAATSCEAAAIEEEYHALFIGLGRGELVPYGSWYQTGFLMEKPLGELRDDLAALGFERQEGVQEPEDHVAALCEVMSMLIQSGVTLELQRAFHRNHLGGWLGRFFNDLSLAEAAVFYRAVGRFGATFTALETVYLD